MMAGYVYLVTDPTGFLVGFIVSEFISVIVSSREEGLLMIMKVYEKLRLYANCLLQNAIAFWEANLPSRENLLMSL